MRKSAALLSTLVVSVCAVAIPAGAETLKKDAIETIVRNHAETELSGFDEFLEDVQSDTDQDYLEPAIDAYLAGESLAGDDFINLYRLLGIYTRLRYGREAITLLDDMVAIPTDKQGETPQHENPKIIAFGELVQRHAQAFGLNYRNIDNRIFEVTLPGSSDKAFGILTHSDVVPINESDWVLADGTQLDPFETQIIDGKIYGRGTQDDKASIAAALYAMKAMQENDVPLLRSIRLMIETTEETGGEGMEYYKENNELPAYNIVLDSSYPVVVAENGFGTIDAYFPRREASGEGAEIVKLTGAVATNQIPSTSVATIRSRDPQALSQKLLSFGQTYAENNGDDFKVSAGVADGVVDLTVTGKSAHSSEPQTGVNPVPRMTELLSESGVSFRVNHYTDAIRYINDNYGLDYHGEALGIAYEHDFMGPLLVSPTYLSLGDDKLRVAVNLRVPAGEQSVEALTQTIEDELTAYREAHSGLDVSYEVSIDDWMLRDPKGKWLQTLLNIFGDTTGLPAEPISSAGSTTAKLLPTAVNFGPSMPGDDYRGHNANEFKEVENFMLDMQMFTEMMARIGNQEQLD